MSYDTLADHHVHYTRAKISGSYTQGPATRIPTTKQRHRKSVTRRRTKSQSGGSQLLSRSGATERSAAPKPGSHLSKRTRTNARTSSVCCLNTPVPRRSHISLAASGPVACLALSSSLPWLCTCLEECSTNEQWPMLEAGGSCPTTASGQGLGVLSRYLLAQRISV